MKVISIVGARPQFIKLGPLSRELRKSFDELIIHTGQHYDKTMSDLFFEQLEIPKPDINLSIGSGDHGDQTGRMLVAIEREIKRIEPNLVISFGDTNSTLAACLAASKLCVPSLHIEAGLRSFNRSMPEEINRLVADHTADLLFAPTNEAMAHLGREGLTHRAVMTGDIMADSLEYVQGKVNQSPVIDEEYLLLTLHRPYNVDNAENISILFDTLSKLQYKVVFPVHPRTRIIINQHNLRVPKQVELIEPQGYIEFHGLLKHCSKVITDSGGLQKEAYMAGKPCITIRQETEWAETIEAGWNVLKEIDDPSLLFAINNFQPTGQRPDLYGRNVAPRMVSEIKKYLDV